MFLILNSTKEHKNTILSKGEEFSEHQKNDVLCVGKNLEPKMPQKYVLFPRHFKTSQRNPLPIFQMDTDFHFRKFN